MNAQLPWQAVDMNLHCRDQKDQVSGKCASEILRRQEDAAGDFRLDKELFDACQVRGHVLSTIGLSWTQA